MLQEEEKKKKGGGGGDAHIGRFRAQQSIVRT